MRGEIYTCSPLHSNACVVRTMASCFELPSSIGRPGPFPQTLTEQVTLDVWLGKNRSFSFFLFLKYKARKKKRGEFDMVAGMTPHHIHKTQKSIYSKKLTEAGRGGGVRSLLGQLLSETVHSDLARPPSKLWANRLHVRMVSISSALLRVCGPSLGLAPLCLIITNNCHFLLSEILTFLFAALPDLPGVNRSSGAILAVPGV